MDIVAPNMFTGSVLDLEPDTAYEARFVMVISSAGRATMWAMGLL